MSLGGPSPAVDPAPLLSLLDPNDDGPFPTDYFRSAVRRIGEATGFVRVAALPPLPVEYTPPKRLSRTAWLANRYTVYLTLTAHAPIAGDEAFFIDVQSLAFQAALHFLLPELRQKSSAEHSILLHAAVLYCLARSVHDPAHYAYLLLMIHGYLGDEEQQLQALHASFRFTPPQDHSYLTKAQEIWTQLLDLGRYEEAERFLFSLHGSSLPEQQEEVREMVVEALKYILGANGKRK